jgi:rhodanese-related sulfurtransferase
VNDATSVSLTHAYLKAGYEKVYNLKGGVKGAWDDWVKAGYPTEPK